MGSAKEREMVTLFDDHGFAVMRAGGSGSGTEREMPDVLASNGNTVVVVEEKYRTTETRCYIGEDEVEKLLTFADKFGADAYLAARFSTNLTGVSTADWFFAEPSDVRRTAGGNYVMHHDEVVGERIFADLLAEWSG